MNYDWTAEYINKLFTCNLETDGEKLRDGKLNYINMPLYKYCYVCEESIRTEETIDYNIDNFENDLLFFQNPAKFNDPFDCYLGFSQSQVIRDLLIQELRRKKRLTPENKKIIFKIFNESEAAINANIELNQETTELITDYLSNTDDNYSLYAEVVKELFAQDNNLLQKFISNSLTIRDQQILVDKIYSNPFYIKNISESVSPENLDWVLKVAPTEMKIKIENDPCSLLNKSSGEMCILFDFLKLCTMGLGDNSELAVSEIDNIKEEFNKIAKETLEKSRKIISDQFRVTCLSERKDSPLMWSHYANKHYGFCLEYDFTGTFIKRKYPDLLAAQLMLFPVHYSEQRPLLSKVLFNGTYKMELLKKGKLPQGFLQSLMRGLLYKSEDWSYEREWRIFQFADNEPVMRLPKARKIFLGANIEYNAKKRLIEIATKKNIPVYQMFLKSDKYRFDYYQII